MWLRRRLILMTICLGGLAAGFGAHADERTLYKSVLRDGRVVYGDQPSTNARSTERITVEKHAADPQQAEAAQRALRLTREQLLQDAVARVARRKQIDNAVIDAYSDLKDAEARRVQGREIREGDRQGRRLLSTYTQRQRDLEGEAERKRQQLERLLMQRAALL